MIYHISLSKDECELVLNALQYIQNKSLEPSLNAVKKMQYKNVKNFYANEDSFVKDINYKKQIITEQINSVEIIYDKIVDKMQ
jgi:hypothetical protein